MRYWDLLSSHPTEDELRRLLAAALKGRRGRKVLLAAIDRYIDEELVFHALSGARLMDLLAAILNGVAKDLVSACKESKPNAVNARQLNLFDRKEDRASPVPTTSRAEGTIE